MVNRVLTLEQAARHIHIAVRELFHLAQQGDIPARKRGEEYFFEHRVVDDWAQRYILDLPEKSLTKRHREEFIEHRNEQKEDIRVSSLFRPEWINAAMPSRTRPGAIRDMVSLAYSTGALYDDASFLQEVSERESIASTAQANGTAFLHARYPDAYRASESFCVLGRAGHPVFFGAQDGVATDLFFLLCCVDDELHLHALARLCLLCRETSLLDDLRAAQNGYEMFDALTDAESLFLDGLRA